MDHACPKAVSQGEKQAWREIQRHSSMPEIPWLVPVAQTAADRYLGAKIESTAARQQPPVLHTLLQTQTGMGITDMPSTLMEQLAYHWNIHRLLRFNQQYKYHCLRCLCATSCLRYAGASQRGCMKGPCTL